MGKRKLDNASSNPNKISKLSSFGFTSNLNKENGPESKLSEPLTSDAPIKKKGKFLESWKINRPWLKYNSEQNLMFCELCIQFQLINVFTTGCSMIKKEAITKHEKRTGDNSHTRAVECTKQSKSMHVAREAALSKQKVAVVSVLKNVYFAAKNHLSNALNPKLNELCIDQGATQLKDLHVDGRTSYSHNQSVQEFQKSIATVLENSILDRVRQFGIFSIMIDESSEVSVQQNLVIYVRYLEEELGRVHARNSFLGIRQLSLADADSIREHVVDFLSSKGLAVSNLVGISTDGTNVMVGCKTGVVKQLKALSPSLLSTHCIAHRLALSCGGAADRIPYLLKFQEILNSLYKYFQNSPKNMSKLESIQSVLKAHGSRHKEVFHTRWLSFEGAVDAIVKNYSSIISVFLEENSARALSLHKPITTYKFLYCAHFLSDVLQQLCYLHKVYQKSDIDFPQVNPLIRSTVSVLEKLRDTKSGHCIRDNAKQRIEAVSACDEFVSGVVNNLSDRFTDEGDAKIMSALTSLFDPILIGNEKISSDVMSIIEDYVVRCAEVIGFFKDEVLIFHALVRESVGRVSLRNVRDVAQFTMRHSSIYPILGRLGQRLLVLPVSTVDCERGFFKQNLIKTDLRNALKIDSLNNLMMISTCTEGPPSENFNYDKAFDHWADMKSRRILQC